MIGSFKYGFFKNLLNSIQVLYSKIVSTAANSGPSAGSAAGRSVGISDDGNIIAESEPGSNRIRVASHNNAISYGFISDTGATGLGYNLAINSAGNRVLYSRSNSSGQVLVKQFSAPTTWTQIGQTLTIGNYPIPMSINGIGNIFIVSSPLSTINGQTNSGASRIYELIGSLWTQKGDVLKGAFDERSGTSNAINKAGNIIAIGAPYSSAELTKMGSVSTYEWISNAWVKKGSILKGDEVGGRFGGGVCLNYEGNRLAVSAPNKLNANGSRGHVKIYEWKNSDWVQMGQTIVPSVTTNDAFGNSMSLNGDGNIILIGDHSDDSDAFPTSDQGSISIYQWDGSNWILNIPRVLGSPASTTRNDNFGFSVAISNTGDKLIVGAPNNDFGGTTNKGRYYTYTLTP
jgi:hypothetical protein